MGGVLFIHNICAINVYTKINLRYFSQIENSELVSDSANAGNKPGRNQKVTFESLLGT